MHLNLNNIRKQPIICDVRFLSKEREQTLYVSQWLWARQTVQLIDTISQFQRIAPVDSNDQKPTPRPHIKSVLSSKKLTKNKWGFSESIWNSIIDNFRTESKLYETIAKRRRNIRDSRERWRSFIQKQQKLNPFYVNIRRLVCDLTDGGTYFLSPDQVEFDSEGMSGAYFLSDQEGNIRFVIKPIDEEIDCINNANGFASPYDSSTIRKNILLYQSALKEVLTYELARHSGVVPHTVLAIVECGAFNDQIDLVSMDERVRYEQLIGYPDREKLCSVQEFIPNCKTLFAGLHELQAYGLTEDQIEARFDQRDFEEANILLWITHDTEGYLNRFLVYPKSSDAIGNEILGIKKIDNGFSFPEKNEQFRNHLRYLPNAKRCLSSEARKKIADLSVERLSNQLRHFGLAGSIQALCQRLTILKELTLRENLSLREIDARISIIGQPNGLQLALSSLSQDELEQIFKGVQS